MYTKLAIKSISDHLEPGPGRGTGPRSAGRGRSPCWSAESKFQSSSWTEQGKSEWDCTVFLSRKFKLVVFIDHSDLMLGDMIVA